MNNHSAAFVAFLLALSSQSVLTNGRAGSHLVTISLETRLVPSPVAVDVLLPSNYENDDSRLPLMVWLHGGTSGKNYLRDHLRPFVETAWATGDLIPCVIAAPVTGASFFMDWHDGSQRWDAFIIGELLDYLRSNFRVGRGKADTVIAGSSFGGQGVLRVALRHPEKFAAAAAMAPGFPAVLKLEDWDISYFGSDVMSGHAARFGDPVDRQFWRATHPPTMVVDNANRLRESGLRLLIDVGDEDANGNFRSVELLHRLLFDAAIPHDYHLHQGAAHVGRSKRTRFPIVFRFLSEALRPDTTPDAAAERHKRKAIRRGRFRQRTTNELPFSPARFSPAEK